MSPMPERRFGIGNGPRGPLEERIARLLTESLAPAR
jgi:hypothetical protein